MRSNSWYRPNVRGMGLLTGSGALFKSNSTCDSVGPWGQASRWLRCAPLRVERAHHVQICETAPVTGALIFGLAVAAIVALLWMMRNATLLFSAEVERGRIVTLRGRAPKGLVRDMTDVLRQRPVEKASLRVVVEGGAPALHATGDLNEGEQQRLRNVLGTWPLAKIRAAPYRTVRREG